MPLTKSAIKKLRQDKKREKLNNQIRKNVASIVKKAKKQKSEKVVKEAISAIDKAVKKSLIHKNRAARIKSSLVKLVKITPQKKSVKTQKGPQKKVSLKKKTSPKKK